MDNEIEKTLANKPFVKGVLCADSNGLLLSGLFVVVIVS